MVEFAIAANLFFVVTFACVEFARMNMILNLAQDAAYYAARKSMVPGATTDEAEREARRVMSPLVTHGLRIDVDPISNTSTDIRVTVTVSLNDASLLPSVFLKDRGIQTTAVMRKEKMGGTFSLHNES